MVNVVATLWYDIVPTSETDVVTNFILDVYTMWWQRQTRHQQRYYVIAVLAGSVQI